MNLELETLERTFDLIAPRGDELMDVFYSRLFGAAAAVEPQSAPSDLERQKAMLLSTLVLVRKSLRDRDALVPTLFELGARHVAHSARPKHCPDVAEVLIASMAEVAGPAWRPEFERAWGDALGVVADVMIAGANAAELEAAA